ncbi:MAG: CehA/McbA family metallohydrolase [Polyangiaceae bacterium]
MRSWLTRTLPLFLLLARPASAAETVLDLSGSVPEDGLRHFFIEFDVPAGTKEIEIAHDDLSSENILDWGLVDASGAFRGWGGGNEENAVVGELAASRSYRIGAIAPGKWKVVVGKAKIKVTPATYSVKVTLRDVPTLAAQTERKAHAEPAPLALDTRWYAGDFHVHSIESGDAKPPLDEIANYAKGRGLDFVMVSDHNTNSQLDFYAEAQKKHPDFLFVPGVEFTTYWGHANGIGATTYVDDKTELPGNSITSAAQAFRGQGALFSLNHPTLALGDACIGCGWEQDLALEHIDAVEIGTGKFGILTDSAVTFWDDLCAKGRHLAALGGSDDHKAGVDETPTQSPIGSPTTLVYAKALSTAALIDAISVGRTVVKLKGPDDPMVELVSSVAPNGDTIGGATELTATITGGTGTEHSARFVKNGKAEPEVSIDSDPFVLSLKVKAPASGEDRYRVEVLEGGSRRTVTSHLWVTAASGPGDAGVGGSGTGGSHAGTAADSSDDGGCGCELPGRARANRVIALGLVGVGFGLWRRRARNRRGPPGPKLR